MEDINLELVKSIIPDECKHMICVIFNDCVVKSFDTLDDALNYQFEVPHPTILYLPTEYFENM